MSRPPTANAQRLLRGLASGDESKLRAFVAGAPTGVQRPARAARRPLPLATARLIHLGALLAVGASTTSLRWAVDLARAAGAENEEIIDVLATVAPLIGSARVVATAPRLALAIGYDLEVEGWDGL